MIILAQLKTTIFNLILKQQLSIRHIIKNKLRYFMILILTLKIVSSIK